MSGRPEALKAALGGDRVRLAVPSAQLPAVREALAAGWFDDIPAPTIRGLPDGVTQLEWTLPAVARAAARVTEALHGAGVSILGIFVNPPSLDDVFQAHTGRTLQEAQEQAIASGMAPEEGRGKTGRPPQRAA